MITILKLASISAVLSAGVVTAYEAPIASTPTSSKTYQDRVAPEASQRLTIYADATKAMTAGAIATDATSAPNCGAQTWPYLSRDCVASTDGTPNRKVVRTITVERRDAPNTSTLVRLPTNTVASR